jgi:hypothetical protein
MFVGVPRATTTSAPDVQVSTVPPCYHPRRWTGVRNFTGRSTGKAPPSAGQKRVLSAATSSVRPSLRNLFNHQPMRLS